MRKRLKRVRGGCLNWMHRFVEPLDLAAFVIVVAIIAIVIVVIAIGSCSIVTVAEMLSFIIADS